MINIKKLTTQDKGKWVLYNPSRKTGETKGSELGKLKSWTDKYIFVVYECDDNWDKYINYTGSATLPKDLRFLDPEETIEVCKVLIDKERSKWE